MQSRWSDQSAAEFVDRYAQRVGEALALRTYTARLLGADDDLVLHGGGNCSVKGSYKNLLGECLPAIYVKASGYDMARIEPEGFTGLDLEALKKLRVLEDLDDPTMIGAFRTRLIDPEAPTPSIETILHAFLPSHYVDHTHADAILALTNQVGGKELVQKALGDGVVVLDYIEAGFKLAKAVINAWETAPNCSGMVLMKHGLVTCGATAEESYGRTIALVTAAEQYLVQHATKRLTVEVHTPLQRARECLVRVAPMVRGLLARPTGDPDRPFHHVILQPLIREDILELLDSAEGRGIALSPPLTSDHLIRTKALPLWVESPNYNDIEKLREQLAQAIKEYCNGYNIYLDRHAARLSAGVRPFDPFPRVLLLRGLGALCVGCDATAAGVAADITAHTLAVKRSIAAMGTYAGLSESQLFDMEYRPLQHAKLTANHFSLAGQVGLVTGAAGAIGSAISQELLKHGAHVAITDLPGEALDELGRELRDRFGQRVVTVPLDVTEPCSVARAFESIICTWGGIDLVIANAGIAHVAALDCLDLETFRKLERVNVEGTLNVLAEAARHFKLQQTGGDVVLVSTKNVFSPGAQFGAYSASKAAAHQLARVASLEMAPLNVRVNMVSPDAVFSHGDRKSGLWAAVGPQRMRARGLDEKGLEQYYQNRNLLKIKVTGQHVAKAVLFFATRQTPTTGTTLPVDGGLPDATPR